MRVFFFFYEQRISFLINFAIKKPIDWMESISFMPNLCTRNLCSSFKPHCKTSNHNYVVFQDWKLIFLTILFYQKVLTPSNPGPPTTGSANTNFISGYLSNVHATKHSFSSHNMEHVLYTNVPPGFNNRTA